MIPDGGTQLKMNGTSSCESVALGIENDYTLTRLIYDSEGNARVTIFAAEGNARTFDFQVRAIAYDFLCLILIEV